MSKERNEETREEKLSDLALIRNYAIDVLATAILKADGRDIESMTAKLAAQESVMLDVIEKR